MDELKQAVQGFNGDKGQAQRIGEVAKKLNCRVFQNVGTKNIYSAFTPWEIQSFEGSLSFREIC
jgi:hypothetical protein